MSAQQPARASRQVALDDAAMLESFVSGRVAAEQEDKALSAHPSEQASDGSGQFAFSLYERLSASSLRGYVLRDLQPSRPRPMDLLQDWSPIKLSCVRPLPEMNEAENQGLFCYRSRDLKPWRHRQCGASPELNVKRKSPAVGRRCFQKLTAEP